MIAVAERSDRTTMMTTPAALTGPIAGLTKEQHALRRTGIGASEVGAVLGLDKYKSPLDVWLEKTGRVAPEATPPSQAAKMGLLLEPVIAQLAEERYAHEFPNVVVRLQSPGTVVGPESWILATPDREVFMQYASDVRAPVVPARLLEMKTKSWNTFQGFGASGTDQVPDVILCQSLWQMIATGVMVCDVAVLVDGREFHVYPVPFDRELAEDVVERVGEWWQAHVVRDVEPAVSRFSDIEYLRRKFGQVTADLMPINDTAAMAVAKLAMAREAKDHAEHAEEMAKAAVMQLLGEFKGIHTPSGKVSWNTVKGRATTNWQAIVEALQVPTSLIESHTHIGAPSRQFRFTPAKGE